MISDLHSHTHYSDGKQSPAELVQAARDAGVTILAITDHETAAGVKEAVIEGERLGLDIVPGVEISSRFKSVEVHLVGLWIDPDHPALDRVTERVMEERHKRGERMVEKLKALGLGISMEDVLAAKGKGGVGRPHVAKALIEAGVVKTYKEAFQKYIGKDGPAYVPRLKFDPAEAIEVIHSAGGLAALAHPLVGGPQREHVEGVARMGLDAVEVVHPKLDEDMRSWLRWFADSRGLLVSGGSDWHGKDRSEGELGKFSLAEDELEALRRRAMEIGSEKK